MSADGLDLVCGPDGPLPDSHSRYRVLAHLGTGGQAVVYRGVRVSAGLRSSPVTIKVFHAADGSFSRDDQLGFWDKGDAVLMDITSRGVSGIPARLDGFYGAPPRSVDTAVETDERVPFQILDYLPGGTVIDRLRDEVGSGKPPTLNGLVILRTLAGLLATLHHPEDGDLPVLHMDVKPANVLLGPTGAVHLIDFTASRYHDSAHLTSVAHSPDTGGPEALGGEGKVGPAYDVHGFGSVAFYLVTGCHPRLSEEGRSRIRKHPLLDDNPLLARHLLAPLADRPGDRPATRELPEWITQLGRLLRTAIPATQLVRWDDASNGTRIAEPREATASFALAELAELRMVGSAAVVAPPEPPPVYAPPPPPQPMYWAPPPQQYYPQHPQVPQRQPLPPMPRYRGRGLLTLSIMWFLLCWVIWLATDFFKTQSAQTALTGFGFAVVGAFGVYWLTRLAGYLVRTNMESERPRSILIPNVTTAIFLFTCGISMLSFTPLDIRRIIDIFTS